MATNSGDVKISLDSDKAPCAANSFLSLAKQGFFDDTNCHRLVAGGKMALNVLQCGDPTGSGTGDPGYEFDEELIDQDPRLQPCYGQTSPDSGKEFCTYPAGTVAVAKGNAAGNIGFAVLPRLRGLHPRRGVHPSRPDECFRPQGRAVDRREGCRARHGDTEGTRSPSHRSSRPGLSRGSPCPTRRVESMEFRYLGNSGMKISEITYGNWLTHGSQVENDVATQCVRAALDEGISTFDTADVYANTAAETVLGDALKGERRESLEIFTKVYWPTGPGGKNDTGLSRKHIMESINGSLKRLQTDYVDLYQAHRFDTETPLEETMQAFADVVRQGKAHYIGVSEWTADQIRAGHELAQELNIQLISSQPQYSMLWRVIEDEVVPTSRELGVSQIVWSPIAQGVLSGKYKPGQAPPEGSRATDEKGGADMIKRFMDDDVLQRIQDLEPVAKELDLTMAQLAVAWVLQNDNVAAALVGASRPEQVTENVKAAGVKIPDELMTRIDDALGDVVERDPGKTAETAPKTRVA